MFVWFTISAKSFKITCKKIKQGCTLQLIGLLKKKKFLSTSLGKYDDSEAAIGGVLWKKVFLEISQNLQENTNARDTFLDKVARFWDLGHATL